jgi:two-component system cell cycle sensor histidine kinase/response regulator CckA
MKAAATSKTFLLVASVAKNGSNARHVERALGERAASSLGCPPWLGCSGKRRTSQGCGLGGKRATCPGEHSEVYSQLMHAGAAFDTLLEHMPVGLAVWQLADDLVTLRIVCANPAAEALCGVALSKQVGKSMAELFPNVPYARALEYVELAKSGAQGVMVSLEDTRTPLTTFSVRALAMPDRCVGVVFQDLAEQSAELAKREERFRRLIQNSDDGLVLADAQGRPTFVSESVTKILGHRTEDVTGRDSFLQMHPEDIAPMRAVFARVLASPEQRFVSEARMLHADGSWRLLEIVNSNHLSDPNVRAVVANFRDITERKRIAEALRKTEEQLLHSQKLEAVGRLAGGIAHDFNNLLSVVLSYADLMLANREVASVHSELQEIRKAGVWAAELTHQLLAFSRQQILAPQVLDVNDRLNAMSGMIRRLVGEDIELRVVKAAALWEIRVDPGQLEQVLMNLVVNARDAMVNGGTLTLETANVVLDAGYSDAHVGAPLGPSVMLAVTDTGVGMDRSTQDRIFEPFFTTKEHGKGTGLGLSTAFGIVNQSGGSIWVYSELGRGTTFKVYFPRNETPHSAKRRESEAPPAARGNETILLVEDDAGVRAVIRRILEKQGYLVVEAASGKEALQVAEQYGGIQLLLTDVVMPKISGRELAERVLAVRPEIKVLYMSGYTDDSIVHHGVLDEGVAFLQKPITPASLAAKVRAVLDS